MTGRLGIDFGTSNTVIAAWNDAQQDSHTVHIPDLGYQHDGISVIPSLIHYDTDNRRWLGQQVVDRHLKRSRRTFRWMKRYITHRSPLKVRIDGQPISPREAGQTFLSNVLVFAAEAHHLSDEEVAFTVPVEAFEHYEAWLTDVASAAGMPRFRLIDEASAAALGYGAHIQPGDVYLIFDFGGGTLDVSVILIDDVAQQDQSGRRCRVLGKAGVELGGVVFDQWLFQWVLTQHNRSDADEDIRAISNALLVECERAKEILSTEEHAIIDATLAETGEHLHATLSRADFESLLDEREVYTQIDRTIRRAINTARERGYQEDDIKAVLMVGGSSQIPSVQTTVRRIFGRSRVLLHRPLDAVARGAAAFVAGVDFYDHIQHDYAVRYVDRTQNAYNYRVIVPRGTPYPSAEAVARLTVKASYAEQTALGVAIFEMGDAPQAGSQGMELVFDPDGAARMVAIQPDEERHLFWMNEHNQTFLHAEPPAQQGQPRFEVEFRVDANKRLLITARDIQTGQWIYQSHPVVKLT